MGALEYRQVYRGLGESLRVHLMSRLQPWRWPIMLASGGIRVERGAKAIPGVTLETTLLSGDVVVVDDAYGKTWIDLQREANRDFRDYVFCPQRGRDPFLVTQVRALLMERTAQEVPLRSPDGAFDIPHLYALVKSLVPLATRPIRHVVLVSHADEWGNIMIPMHAVNGTPAAPAPGDANAGHMNWESLQEAIATPGGNPLQIHETWPSLDGKPIPRALDGTQKAAFPRVLPRPDHSNGKFVPFAIVIRGCSSGVHTILLNKIREAFGASVDIVVMPKFFEATHTQGEEMVEYFQHNYWVESKTALTRAELLAALRESKFKDWLGVEVRDPEWPTLVPPGIGPQRGTRVARMEVTVKERSQPLALHTFFDAGVLVIGPLTMTQQEKPDAAAMRDYWFRALGRNPDARSGPGDWPVWLRRGFPNLAALVDGFTYELTPGVQQQPGRWQVQGRRNWYRSRTPLLEGGTLVADYHPGRDDRKSSYMIDLNDDRIFGRSDATVQKDPNSKVGVNFSRKL